MNETAARDATLLRAIETGDGTHAAWRDDDREWASRAAAEVVGTDAPLEAFVARRAALALERLGEREPAIGRLRRLFAWRAWLPAVLVAGAFLLGIAVDRIGEARRVNVLAFALLALIAWNLAVYAAILVQAPLRAAGRAALPGALRRVVGRAAGAAPRALPAALSTGPLGRAAVAFAVEWPRLAAPLWGLRVARTLHLAAAALAAGALAGMYLRGLAFEYRAGWESTFLEVGTVHRLLSIVLAPGAALTGIAVPGVERLGAMRFDAGGAGENAADWIHLYAATVAALVIGPRLLLAGAAWLRERALAARMPLPLADPYYARLGRTLSEAPLRVRVVPYSYALPEPARDGLRALLARAFGARTDIDLAPAVAYGEEDALRIDRRAGVTGPGSASGGAAGRVDTAGAAGAAGATGTGAASRSAGAAGRAAPGKPPAATAARADLTVALFSLAATPEAENHGAFVEALAARAAPAVPVALIDESGFARRFAGDPRRLAERREAWRRLLQPRGVAAVFADLAAPDAPEAAAAAAALEAALQGRAHG